MYIERETTSISNWGGGYRPRVECSYNFLRPVHQMSSQRQSEQQHFPAIFTQTKYQ